jgi:hypothetical protein
MKSFIKLGLSVLLVLSAVSCDPSWDDERRFRVLQILQNDQPNTVYSKTMVTYGGKNYNYVYTCDTIYFNRTIKPGDTAQIYLQDVYSSGLIEVDTVTIHIELNDNQSFYQKFPRTYIREQYQGINDFVETIRF